MYTCICRTRVFVAKIGVTVFRDFPSEAWKPKSTFIDNKALLFFHSGRFLSHEGKNEED